jgi:hypothetical protein
MTIEPKKGFSWRTLQIVQRKRGTSVADLGPKVPIMASSKYWGLPEPHEQRLSQSNLWKTRIKSGENAFHGNEVGVRYTRLEHCYCSDLQGGFNEWQQA